MVAHGVTVTMKSREFVCRESCRRIQLARDCETDVQKKKILVQHGIIRQDESKPDGEFLRGIRHEPLNRRESWLV